MKVSEDDQFAQQKLEMLNANVAQRTFRVQTNFNEPIIGKFISYMRFVEFDENIALLY